MKVLFTHDFGKEYFDKLKNEGVEALLINPRKDKIDYDDLKDVEILVDYNSHKWIDITKMESLKAIQLTSVGFNHLPNDRIIEKGITVSNLKGGLVETLSEAVVLFILQIYNESKKFFKQQERHEWIEHRNTGLLDKKKVTIVGTGAIAVETALKLKAFRTEITGINTSGTLRENFDRCLKRDQMKEAFRESDIIILLTPETPETIGMIGDEELTIMKEGSILINVGRGSALKLDELKNHIDKFRGIGLDVFEREPLEKESYLWDKENVIITPHNAGFSERNVQDIGNIVFDSIMKFKNTGKVLNPVNLERGY